MVTTIRLATAIGPLRSMSTNQGMKLEIEARTLHAQSDVSSSPGTGKIFSSRGNFKKTIGQIKRKKSVRLLS